MHIGISSLFLGTRFEPNKRLYLAKIRLEANVCSICCSRSLRLFQLSRLASLSSVPMDRFYVFIFYQPGTSRVAIGRSLAIECMYRKY